MKRLHVGRYVAGHGLSTAPVRPSSTPASSRRSTTRSTRPPAPSSCGRYSTTSRTSCFPTNSSMSSCWSIRCTMSISCPVRRSSAARRAPSSIWSRPDRTVAVQKVKLGPGDGQRIAVLSGPQPGESRRRRWCRPVARRRQDNGGAGAARPEGAAGQTTPQQGAQGAAAPTKQRSVQPQDQHKGRGADTGGAPRETTPRLSPPPGCRSGRWRVRATRCPRRGSKRSDEPVAHLHPAAGRDVAADGGDHAGRACRLSLPAAVGAARGRLPDDPGADASTPAPAPT